MKFRNQPNWLSFGWIFFELPMIPFTELLKRSWKKDLGWCSKCEHSAIYTNKYNSSHYSHGLGWYKLTAVCQTEDCKCVNSKFKKIVRLV